MYIGRQDNYKAINNDGFGTPTHLDKINKKTVHGTATNTNTYSTAANINSNKSNNTAISSNKNNNNNTMSTMTKEMYE